MDGLIATAERALAAGDALAALKFVALREDPTALALRGIAMAQLGDLDRARLAMRAAMRGFPAAQILARSRCRLVEAEIALAARDLVGAGQTLADLRLALDRCGDRVNAAHAGYLQARLWLLTGRPDDAARALASVDLEVLPGLSRPGYWLAHAGVAMRQVRAGVARTALHHAENDARRIAIPAVSAEVARVRGAFDAPAARLLAAGQDRLLNLDAVEALMTGNMLIVDACRNGLRHGATVIPLARRPVLFALLRVLAECWPGDASRELLLARAFHARHADDSHRARLRVEIGRLRELVGRAAEITATGQGYRLDAPHASGVAVLAPPVEGDHAGLLALLADGEAWSSSALALALGVSARTVQRGLAALAGTGQVDWFGQGRARRWTARQIPGYPTCLLLPSPMQPG